MGSGKKFLTFVLNMSEGGEKWGNRARTHTCAPHARTHTHTHQTWTQESLKLLNTDSKTNLGHPSRIILLLVRDQCRK